MRGLLLVLVLASCLPPRAPSASYGEQLRACDTEPSEDEWVDCCVRAARAYNQDPNFCFE